VRALSIVGLVTVAYRSVKDKKPTVLKR